MNINYKQSQFELFPGTTGSPSDVGKPRYLFANLTLSVENIVIIGIITLMTMVFAFSLGVEKGKKITNFSPSSNDLHPVLAKRVSTTVTAAIPEKLIMVAKGNPPAKTSAAPAAPMQTNQTKKPPIVVPATSNLPSTPNKPYTIQVASFKDDQYAKKEATILKNKNLDSFVITKGNFFIVCVGKFSKKEEAGGLLVKLKRNYNDCLVRRF